MENIAGGNAALVFGLALAIGMLAQVAARHLQIPGIVLLLAAGVLFGPDVLNAIRPDDLGGTVHTIVNFAVAIILFEGGLNLEIRRLLAEALVIRRLVTIGAIITGIGAAFAAGLIMDWEWRLATLFGTLVIVTGPTVVTPLLRRLRVKQPLSTILEAEGVLIDPIGAIIAVVALEFLYPIEGGFATRVLARPAIVLVTGAGIGFVGGLLVALLLRPRRLVPEGLENVLVLSLVIAMFQISEALVRESGLAAVVAAGMTIGNMKTRRLPGLLEFKEQLTILMIGLLFVLLAADVRLAEVRALGVPAAVTVAALMLVVRPVQSWLCTIGSGMTWQERTFIASLAPRGIVAAAIASLFAETITARGLPGGTELRALVFVVIAATVTVHGLTGGFVAQLLGLRRATKQGYVFLGGNGLTFALARLLGSDQPDILVIDANPDRVMAAQRQGLRVLYGQGLQSTILERAELDSKLGCIGLTPNEEVNLLWANRIRAETRVPRVYVALRSGPRRVPTDTVHHAGAFVLFGEGKPVDLWSGRLDRGDAVVERWRCTRAGPPAPEQGPNDVDGDDLLLILTVRRAGRVRPVDDETAFRERDEADIAVLKSRREEATKWLERNGWVEVEVAPERAGGAAGN